MARVLIMEDDSSIASILGRLMKHAGHEVALFPDGLAGWIFLAESPAAPDIVLLDLFMPKMNGKTVLAAMRANPRLAQVPVILITGAMPTHDDFPPAVSFQAFIAKPFAITVVLDTIHRLLALPEECRVAR